MFFIRPSGIVENLWKKSFGPGTLAGNVLKDDAGWIAIEERWALRLALGALGVGLVVGLFSAMTGLGLALLGFLLGATLRVDAACMRHVMNQQQMIELQRQMIQEIRKSGMGTHKVDKP